MQPTLPKNEDFWGIWIGLFMAVALCCMAIIGLAALFYYPDIREKAFWVALTGAVIWAIMGFGLQWGGRKDAG